MKSSEPNSDSSFEYFYAEYNWLNAEIFNIWNHDDDADDWKNYRTDGGIFRMKFFCQAPNIVKIKSKLIVNLF